MSRPDATLPPCDSMLNYIDIGAGSRTIVLVHGYTDSLRSFDLVLPHLTKSARCVALDQRGHGGTAYDGDDFSISALAQDATELVERLGAGSVALVGHSMGSFVARAAALRRPDLFDRLVLVGGALRPSNENVNGLHREVMAMGESIPLVFVEEFQAGCLFDRAAAPAPFFEQCVRTSHSTSPRVWRAALSGMLAHDDHLDLGRIACPTLVIGGEHDAVFSAGEQRDLARAIPRARIALYENVGHSPHWERPERFARDVLACIS